MTTSCPVGSRRWDYPRAFTEQTDLPVYQIGVPGFWTINGWWGNRHCPYNVVLERFLLLAVDFDERQAYAVILDTQGNILRKQSVKTPVTSFSIYHAGGLYWSPDGRSYRIHNEGWFDAETGRFLREATDDAKGTAVGSRQIRNIDLGNYDQITAPDQYGLFTRQGDNLTLRYSVAELLKLRARLRPNWAAFPDTPVDVCSPKLSGDGRWYCFEFGNHEATRLAGDNPPRVNEMWICSADLRTIYPVIPYREDEQTFLNHATFDYPDVTKVHGAVGTGVAVGNLDGSDLRYLHLGDYWFAGGGGHPSLSPNRKWLIYDTYNDYGQLLLVEMATGAMWELLRVPRLAESVPSWWTDQRANHGNGPSDVDLHPNWTADGQVVTFNGMFGSFSQVYAIDVSSIVA